LSEIFFALLKREVERYFNDKKRLLASLILPITWLIIFGPGFGLSFRYGVSDISYEQYILPGIVGMTILFGSLWSGTSVLRDEQTGFAKILKTSPVSDITKVASKSLATSFVNVLQVIVLIVLYSIFVSQIATTSIIYVLIITAIMSFAFSSLGILIASFIDTQESYDTVINILVIPILFLSGALFPIEKTVIWMHHISNLNPLTYGIDIMRQLVLGISNFSFIFDIGVIIFSTIFLFACSVFIISKK